MKWRNRTFDWRRRFAWLPVRIDDHYIWWEPYWRRFCGDSYEVQQEPPVCENCGGGPVFCRHCQDWRNP